MNNSIKQLDSETARKICSGQVITSMAVAVKELIENALDAKATCLSIRFVDYGKELIEVLDNGTGIEDFNFSLLGKRNCTSKLKNFNDLEHVQTFGFRGEAIGSLCNISKVSIHTRHASKSIGTLLKFDTKGEIINKELIAREVGTTVSLSQLFYSLPVRRKELNSNARRSFEKTISLIYQYCVGIIGLKIICSHMHHKSGRFANLFTSTGCSIQSNIIEIFDYKQFSNLMPFVCHKLIEETCAENIEVEITGFISKPDTGCGRSSSERQYFYLNERPCDLPLLSKKINQIYRMYNRNQYPFILLKINLDESLIDRNLTPDKRKILLADNHYIFKVVQNSFELMFSRENTEIESMSSSQIQQNMSSFLKRSLNDDSDNDCSSQIKLTKRCPSPCDSFFIEPNNSYLTENSASINENSFISNISSIMEDSSEDLQDSTSTAHNVLESTRKNNTYKPKQIMHPFFASLKTTPYSSSNFVKNESISRNNDEVQETMDNENNVNYDISDISISANKSDVGEFNVENDFEKQSNLEKLFIEQNFEDNDIMKTDKIENFEDDNFEELIATREISYIDVTTDSICKSYSDLIYKSQSNFSNEIQTHFNAKITPEDNEVALKELKHTLSKQSFAKMKVIGQFNLGFIITKLFNNLFIVDQHAIDERYNFEKFLTNPNVNHQNLVCPLNLRLSCLNEMTVIDNLDTFERFGFGIEVKKDASVGQRVFLNRIPLGKEWVGGRSDIEEIIAAIRDSPTGNLTEDRKFILSGLQREIAYKACRSSVMIGEALTHLMMEKILSKIGDLRDPWHCAHNRPTIRHLLCLDQIRDL